MSIERDEVLVILPASDEWISEIIVYKTQGMTPNYPTRIRKVMAMALSYKILDGKLFKLSFGEPVLWCVTKAKAEWVMAEIHEGICVAYQGVKTLARKVILQRY